MFLKKIFGEKPETILVGELQLSNNSTFKLLSKNEFIQDKELILLCLLVYTRILRAEISKKEIDNLLEIFNEYYSLFRKSNNQKKLIDNMLTVLGISSRPHRFKQTKSIKLKKVKNGNIYLDLGVLHIDPLASAIYTVFIYVFNTIESKRNKIHLLEALTLLSSHYKDEKFTIRSATDIPNSIVYEIIPFDEELEFDINF